MLKQQQRAVEELRAEVRVLNERVPETAPQQPVRTHPKSSQVNVRTAVRHGRNEASNRPGRGPDEVAICSRPWKDGFGLPFSNRIFDFRLLNLFVPLWYGRNVDRRKARYSSSRLWLQPPNGATARPRVLLRRSTYVNNQHVNGDAMTKLVHFFKKVTAKKSLKEYAWYGWI